MARVRGELRQPVTCLKFLRQDAKLLFAKTVKGTRNNSTAFAMYLFPRSCSFLILLYINPSLAVIFQPEAPTNGNRMLLQHLIIKPESSLCDKEEGQA